MLFKILFGMLMLSLPTIAGYVSRSRGLLPETTAVKITRFAVVWLGTPILILTMWHLELAGGRLFWLPVIGIGVALISLGAGLLMAGRFRLEKRSRGSFVISSSISNLGETFGGLLAFILMGQQGFGLATLYALFFQPYTFSALFWIAGRYSSRSEEGLISYFRHNPDLLLPMLAIAVGLIFNLSGLPEIEILVKANSVLIPLSSAVWLYAIGMRLHISSIHRFRRIIPAYFILKFILSPVVALLLAWAIGIWNWEIREPLRVIFIESITPAAVFSMAIPMIFDLDVDLAGALWLTSTIVAVALVPVIMLVAAML